MNGLLDEHDDTAFHTANEIEWDDTSTNITETTLGELTGKHMLSDEDSEDEIEVLEEEDQIQDEATIGPDQLTQDVKEEEQDEAEEVIGEAESEAEEPDAKEEEHPEQVVSEVEEHPEQDVSDVEEQHKQDVSEVEEQHEQEPQVDVPEIEPSEHDQNYPDESENEEEDGSEEEIENKQEMVHDEESEDDSETNQEVEPDVIDVDSEDEHEQLRPHEPLTHPVVVSIRGDEYLLAPHEGADAELIPLFEDDVVFLSIEELFLALRKNEDLMELYDFQVGDELTLRIDELGGISITEDNVYSRDIRVEDFTRAFTTLQENSTNEEAVPSKLTICINTQPRFITHFNQLSECINSGKGFSHIRSLKRTLDHPSASKRPKLDTT